MAGWEVLHPSGQDLGEGHPWVAAVHMVPYLVAEGGVRVSPLGIHQGYSPGVAVLVPPGGSQDTVDTAALSSSAACCAAVLSSSVTPSPVPAYAAGLTDADTPSIPVNTNHHYQYAEVARSNTVKD